jgi:outer membrane protein assembly factor BamB
MGSSTLTDKSVTPFFADRENAWSQFRLGGGLNVVVVNPKLPRTVTWRFDAGQKGISSSPVVYRDLVLVNSNDGSLYAIDAATGKLRWQYFGSDDLMSQPVYAHGLAIVTSGNEWCYICFYPNYVVGGSGLNEIAAVDLRDGREVWNKRIGGSGMPTPALVGDDVVHGDGSGAVLAFRERTGAPDWAVRLPSEFAMSSAVTGPDGRIYLSGVFQAGVFALNGTNGKLTWQHLFSKYYQGPGDGPMASSGTVLFTQYLQSLASYGKWGWMVQVGSPVQSHIVALDKHTGRLLWDVTVAHGKAPPHNQASIPLVYRGRLYEGSPVAAVVNCLDALTGRMLWQLRTGGAVSGGMVARDGVVYFGDRAGYLWAVNAATGSIIGRLHENAHFRVGSPIILNNSLIDGTNGGTVLALPLSAIRGAHDALTPADAGSDDASRKQR